jgi:hypothetical protein
MRVDWPIFMRRKMLFALARLLKRYDSCAVALNRPLCPFTTPFRKPDRMQEYFGKPWLEKLDDNLYHYSPRYFITDIIANKVPSFEEINLKRLRESYKYLCSAIEIDEPDPLIWFYHPQQGYLTKLFENSFTIMELCDNLVYYDGSKLDEVDRQEQQLRTDVDLLLATSPKLLEKYGSHYKHAWLSGNGLDKQTFERLSKENIQPRPELTEIPSPRIGYTGIISKRLDWELFEQIASHKPEWNFLFVGPVQRNTPFDKMQNYSNVYFTGKYEHSLMPEVLKSFDIGFMPYKDNEFFRYSNPLKFYEFAAAGLCSVSSEMEILSKFDPRFVKIVPNTADEWITAIDNMLERDKNESEMIGKKIAEEHIWDNIYKEIIERINSEFFEG